MSVCVTIRTKKTLQPDDVLKYLADKGEKIVVTSMDFPSVKFGTLHEAIRGIEWQQRLQGSSRNIWRSTQVSLQHYTQHGQP